MISTRRFCGSRVLSGVGTSRLVSPKPRATISLRGTPRRTSSAATLFARRTDRPWLYWAEPEDEISFLPDPPTRLPQFPRRAEVVACYEEITGQALPHAAFYTAFGWWKQACIVEGVYARLVKGASGGMKTAPPEQVARIVERYLERAASALA